MPEIALSQSKFDQLLAQDIAQFYDNPLGFVRYAFRWGEGGLKGFDGPDVWQEDYLRDYGKEIAKRKFDGVNAVEPILNATSSGHGIGKSCLVAWIILFLMSTRPHCKGVVTANTMPQLQTKTWAELAKWHKRVINSHWFNISTGKASLKLVQVDHPDTWRVDGQSCREENSESFAGLHAADSTAFFIFDEASAIPDTIWEVAEGGTTDGEPHWHCFGNPTRNTGRFKECFGRYKHRWSGRRIDSRTCKMTNKVKLQQWIDDYGEDSDFVRVRIKGEFPRAGSMQFIPGDAVDTCTKLTCEPDVYYGLPKVLGVDVARFGDDQSVICMRQGRKVWPLAKYRELSITDLSSKVAEFIRVESPDAVFVDAVGVGAGVVDMLRLLGHQVIEVLGNASPTKPHLYFNKRAEMWGEMKNYLIAGADIPKDSELVDDLIGPEFTYNTKQQIVLEQKKDMKSRGLASPDCADALAMTFYQQVQADCITSYEPDWEE